MSETIKPVDYTSDKVECNMCHKFLLIPEYELHYERCLDITYLLDVAKQKGEAFTRDDLEHCRSEVIDKLLNKYPPEPIQNLMGFDFK